MMKIGQLMLDGGRSGDQRILPQEWVAQSVAPHAVVDRQPGCGTDYGYFWWLGPACPATGEPAWFSAIGNGGQRIFVVAEFDLVIVVTAGLYNDRRQRLIRDITAGAIAWASQAAR
jgi:CubicO group peptidase (beta-lactamase class C family)